MVAKENTPLQVPAAQDSSKNRSSRLSEAIALFAVLALTCVAIAMFVNLYTANTENRLVLNSDNDESSEHPLVLSSRSQTLKTNESWQLTKQEPRAIGVIAVFLGTIAFGATIGAVSDYIFTSDADEAVTLNIINRLGSHNLTRANPYTYIYDGTVGVPCPATVETGTREECFFLDDGFFAGSSAMVRYYVHDYCIYVFWYNAETFISYSDHKYGVFCFSAKDSCPEPSLEDYEKMRRGDPSSYSNLNYQRAWGPSTVQCSTEGIVVDAAIGSTDVTTLTLEVTKNQN